MKYNQKQSGFSAVELLITLFIAAVFLITGFQLYAVIIKNGSDARQQALAANTAADYLQQYESVATSPCTAQTPRDNITQTPLSNFPITVSGLSNVTLTVAIQCPYTSYSASSIASFVSKIVVTITYGNSGQSLSNSTYVSSPGLITNGLVLNLDGGSTASYPGTLTTWTDLSTNGNNCTLINGVGYTTSNNIATLTFNGSNNYVDCLNSTSFDLTNQLTISVWVKWTASALKEIFIKNNNTNDGVGAYEFHQKNNQVEFITVKGTSSALYSAATITTGTWVNIVAIYDGTTKYIYINGVQDVNTQAQTSPIDTTTGKLTIGAYGNAGLPFNGSIGEALLYNRALSPSEVLQNYNALRNRYGL